MPRDYKHTSSKNKPSAKSSGPSWTQLWLGLGLGLVIAAGVHLHHRGGFPELFSGERAAPRPAPPAPAVSMPAAEKPAPAQDTRPRFEFYKLLPEMEVVVPEEQQQRQLRNQPETAQPVPPQPAERQPAQRTTPAAPPGTRFMLQAGSFQSFGDADRLKAQLALLGVEASIQTVEIRAGETWHRVRIGPFTEGSELTQVRQRLETNGVEAILLRLGS